MMGRAKAHKPKIAPARSSKVQPVLHNYSATCRYHHQPGDEKYAQYSKIIQQPAVITTNQIHGRIYIVPRPPVLCINILLGVVNIYQWLFDTFQQSDGHVLGFIRTVEEDKLVSLKSLVADRVGSRVVQIHGGSCDLSSRARHFSSTSTAVAKLRQSDAPFSSFTFSSEGKENKNNSRQLTPLHHQHMLIIAIEIFCGKLQIEEAIELIRLEEDIQMDRWGLVEGSHDVGAENELRDKEKQMGGVCPNNCHSREKQGKQ
ncbi:hypothetical protein ACFX10_014705 [Malus domestica]